MPADTIFAVYQRTDVFLRDEAGVMMIAVSAIALAAFALALSIVMVNRNGRGFALRRGYQRRQAAPPRVQTGGGAMAMRRAARRLVPSDAEAWRKQWARLHFKGIAHWPRYHWRLALYDHYIGTLKKYGADHECPVSTEALIRFWCDLRAEVQRELEAVR